MHHRENYTPGSEIRRKIGKNFENLIIILFLILEQYFYVLKINLLHLSFFFLNSVQRITFHARNTSISSRIRLYDLKFNLSRRLSASLIPSVQNIATPEFIIIYDKFIRDFYLL